MSSLSIEARTAKIQEALLKGRVSMRFSTTNAHFAKTDKVFQQACESVEIKPTARQASKYRNKRGLAFKRIKTV